MNKEKVINKLIAELQKDKHIYDKADNYIFGKEEFDTIEWDDIAPYFNQLDNIETYHSLFNYWKDNSLADISKLKNLKHLQFQGGDIETTEEYLKINLKKFAKLKTLWFAGTKLKTIPISTIQAFKNLENLSLIGNEFYKQNFHFKLSSGSNNIIGSIHNFCEQILSNFYNNNETERRVKELTSDRNLFDKFMEANIFYLDFFKFEKYKWGLINHNKNILILKDDFINSDTSFDSVSIYILDKIISPIRTKYEIFKRYSNLFKEMNKKEKLFETDSSGNLKVFFYEKNKYDETDIIYFEKLKNLAKAGIKNYDNKLTIELLKYFGGEQIFKEIEKERVFEEVDRRKEFENNKTQHLTRISVKNFKIFKDNVIENLSKINIIIGKNGTGKTSLLQAIAICLIPDNTNEISSETYNKYEKFINQSLQNETELLKNAEVQLSWKDEFERKIYIHQSELKQNKELPQTYLVLAYGENLFSKLNYIELQENYKILINGDNKTHNVISLFHDFYDKITNPLEILDKLNDEILSSKISEKEKQKLIKIKDLLFNTLNDFLDTKNADLFKIKYIEKDKNHRFIDKSGFLLNLHQISEAYRTNILLITDILVKILSARNRLFIDPFRPVLEEIFDYVKGTVIIDEFDKHLHPAWQKSFVGILESKLPNIQFILTTHNVVALQSAEGQTALKMDINKKGEISIMPEIIKKGDSIETLLNKFFGWNSQFFSKNTQTEFNRFKELAGKICDREIEIDEEFSDLARKLAGTASENENMQISEELKSKVTTQIAQIEYITKKTIKL